MASPSAPLLGREQLADLNQLRNGPGLVRLATHLSLGAGGIGLWSSDLPMVLRLVGLVIGGTALATCFAPLHECCHRTAFRHRGLNDAVAWWAGVLSFYNSTFYRRYHQWHHRYAHQPGLDPELDDPQPTTPLAYGLELSGWTWWIGKFRSYGRLLFGDLRGLPYLSPEVIPQVRRSVRLQFAVYGLVALLSFTVGQGWILWGWLLPLAVGQPLLRFLLLAEHAGCSFSSDGTANTRTTLTLAPLRWLMWNMPFHAEHHLYPSLPFHALPKAHELVAPSLQHCDRGYWRVHRRLLRDLSQLALPA